MALNVRLLRSNYSLISITEMRMLKWISENTWKDKIQNEKICIKIRVAPIDEKMKENHLRWFGHVQRRATDAPVKQSELIQVETLLLF